jgi:hypothetical protein
MLMSDLVGRREGITPGTVKLVLVGRSSGWANR